MSSTMMTTKFGFESAAWARPVRRMRKRKARMVEVGRIVFNAATCVKIPAIPASDSASTPEQDRGKDAPFSPTP